MGRVKKKKAGLCTFEYTPTDNQQQAYVYCVNNNIIISPVAAESGLEPTEWYVGISDPNTHRKVYKSKFKYNNQQIWEAMYEACEYYYNKIK